MKAFIMPNLDKKNADSCTQLVIKRLNEYGITPILDQKHSKRFSGLGAEFMEFYVGVFESNVVIAIGGDGTFIHSAKHAAAYDKPLLGINVGRLGFLAGLETAELSRLSLLNSGDYVVENRMMLNCVHYSGENKNEYLALNDIVISNGAISRIVELDVSCNGRLFTTYRADGIIVSTPTGSTAYALSAGGPVMEPSINSIAISPICPHTLVARTLIFSEDKTISVSPAEENLHPIYITVDGEQGAKLVEDDYIQITKSDKIAKLINLNDKTFYDILYQKFNITKSKSRMSGT